MLRSLAALLSLTATRAGLAAADDVCSRQRAPGLAASTSAQASDPQGESTTEDHACLLSLRAPSRPRAPLPLDGKSVYFILVDRFARSNGNSTECGFTDGFQDNNWCNGTIEGIINHLDYIQGMGFECIWISPIVEQFPGRDGGSGYGSHGYWARNIYEVDPHFGDVDAVQRLAKALHSRGMCFILDIVANHMGPVHSADIVSTYFPFNETRYYHQLDIGDLTFDQYVQKHGGWPPPVQCMGPGALCAAGSRLDCGCYQPECGGFSQPPCSPSIMEFNSSSGCPSDSIDSMCRPGSFQCRGYNQTVIHEGWFFDLGDLNQSDAYVFEEQLKWAKWLVKTYMLDGIRLDTAPYMSMKFLSALQDAAGVPILGEVTTTNLTFHASFQADPPPSGTPTLGGVLNFPLTWPADSGFCGTWFPHSTLNLSTLGSRMTEQVQDGLYKNPFLLGNFVDNHDQDRITKLCQPAEKSRIVNSLAWTFFVEGMPIMYYGTEVFMTESRGSFWQFGFQTSTPMYRLIKRMNTIRRLLNISLETQAVLPTTAGGASEEEQLVFRRGGDLYVLLNNRAAARTHEGVEYCVPGFPPASAGKVWVDALSGAAVGVDASSSSSCVQAADAMPKLLVQLPECGGEAAEGGGGRPFYYYDLECTTAAGGGGSGCRADGVNDACRSSQAS